MEIHFEGVGDGIGDAAFDDAGVVTVTYVRKLRIAKAKELLRQKNLRVGEGGLIATDFNLR